MGIILANEETTQSINKARNQIRDLDAGNVPEILVCFVGR